MRKKFRDENTDMFIKAVMSAKDENECYDFFYDLCTESEIKAMAQRLQVARMLKKSKVYSEIVSKTQAGTATISRVNNSLINGTGGYDRAIKRAEGEIFGGDVQ